MATLNPTQRDVVFPVLLFLLLLLLLLFFFYLSPRNQNLPLPLTPNFPSSSPSSDLQTTHQTVQTPRAASFPSSSSSDEYVSTRGVPSNSIDGAASASATDDESVDKEIIEMRIEKGLARARAAIREAIRSKNYTSRKEETFIPRGDVYRNPYAFHQSYIEMEKRFKIWTYREGDLPLVHNGPVNNIYAIEGQFMDELERGNSRLVARDPDEAHVFYLPMSITRIVQYMYTTPINYSANYQERLVTDYIRVIANKYPYWNRSCGADHFLLSCHDWAPEISMVSPDLYKNFIRVLCNANTSERFQPMRDISLPEVNIPPGKLGPPHLDKPPNHRHILAFFAGRESGYMRTLLFNSWKENDDEIQVYEHLPANKSYSESMADSRFCLCPSGWEVASPRIVESITAGCVPVIVSDYYVLPFSEVLDWGKFSIHVPSAKIPKIKKILKAVPFSRYLEMQKRVKQLQRHFVINRPAKPYDLLNMIFHSIWLRRLNVRLPLHTS